MAASDTTRRGATRSPHGDRAIAASSDRHGRSRVRIALHGAVLPGLEVHFAGGLRDLAHGCRARGMLATKLVRPEPDTARSFRRGAGVGGA